MFNQEIVYNTSIIDDCGIIGIVDVDQYASFIGSWASHEEFTTHIVNAMGSGIGLVWGTGWEGNWRITIRYGLTSREGFRDFKAALKLVSGSLLVLDYETMSMDSEDGTNSVANDNFIPTTFDEGLYVCRVIQMYDPNDLDDDPDLRDSDFEIELERSGATDSEHQPTYCIPWSWSQPTSMFDSIR